MSTMQEDVCEAALWLEGLDKDLRTEVSEALALPSASASSQGRVLFVRASWCTASALPCGQHALNCRG